MNKSILAQILLVIFKLIAKCRVSRNNTPKI
jgi:hypothetical protein